MTLKNKLLSALLISIGSANAAASPWPVGTDDKVSIVQNWTISIPVLDNDTGSNLTISDFNTTSVAWGSVTISADKKTLHYVPRNNFVGEDEFWYVLKDDEARTNAAKVIVHVASSAWPDANTDSAEATYDEVIKINVLDNDVGTGLKLIEVNERSTNQGKAWISADNEISYQQYGEARGNQQDEFWYAFEDLWGRKNSAKVIVSITEPQSTPWPVATPESAVSSNGLRVNIPALFNDIGDSLRIEESNEWTQHGGKTRVFGNFIRYTPPANYTGEDSFWYKIVDSKGRTNSTKVDVQVTENTQKSVVEFCGNTYETDGTLANTRFSSLSPATPVSYPSTEIPATQVDGELGTINGRRYFIETSGSQQTIFMDVDGTVTTVSSVDSDTPGYAIATYKGVIYFVQNGRYLFAHDGDKLTELGDVLLDLGAGSFVEEFDYVARENRPAAPDRYTNTVRREVGAGNALYFSILNSIATPGYPTRYRRTYLRISDDLDWRPVKVQTVSTSTGTGGYSSLESASNFYYFNGLDYYDYNFNQGYSTDFRTYKLRARQTDNNVMLQEVEGDVDSFIEDRGRLFVKTKLFDNPNLDTPYQAKLFVVDNRTDQFVELATCQQ